MLRNQNKPALTVGLVALLLPFWASAQTGQGAVPATPPAPAGDVRPRLWAATARFVYADDRALGKIRPLLLKTIDSSSVAGFGEGLKRAVAVEEKAAPKQAHLLKFRGIFEQLSTGKQQKAAPADLARKISDALLENKTTAEKAARQANSAFAHLQMTLQQLASPAATVAAPAAAATGAVSPLAPEPAAQELAASGEPPAAPVRPGAPATSPWTWAALGLSLLSLLVAFFKGKNSKVDRGSGAGSERLAAASSDAPFTSEQRSELRKEVRKELERAINNQPPVAPVPAAPVAAPPLAAAVEAAAPVAAESTSAPAPPPPPRIVFANQQPIDGRFQRDSLAGAPASYTIFELTIDERSPDQARFGVTRNPAGHAGFIGSHHTILGGACTYSFPQGRVTRIVTDVPGTAQRTAAGDWQISQKAQIRFE